MKSASFHGQGGGEVAPSHHSSDDGSAITTAVMTGEQPSLLLCEESAITIMLMT